jgi:tetratricopeptide (TPR) repeat protein
MTSFFLPIATQSVYEAYYALREWMRKGFELAEKAVELEPEEPGEYQVLGMLNMSRGDYDSAIAFREKALKLAPNDFVVVFLQ